MLFKLVKDQLAAGKLVPWRYKEYGKVRVKELFILGELVTKRNTDLAYPTLHDKEMYKIAEEQDRKLPNDQDYLY